MEEISDLSRAIVTKNQNKCITFFLSQHFPNYLYKCVVEFKQISSTAYDNYNKYSVRKLYNQNFCSNKIVNRSLLILLLNRACETKI